jgi:hypothetical protein
MQDAKGLAVSKRVTEGVLCLWPGCAALVAFGAKGKDQRRYGTCPSGHRHYADGNVRYGTER